MRSTWSADRVLRLLATASLEAAWLTLAYLVLEWLAGRDQLDLGIAQLGAAAIVGTLLSRALHRRSRSAYVGVLLGAAALAGAVGIWLAAAPALAGADKAASLVVNSGGWLLGVAVLRGSTHADLEGDAGHAERVLDAGLIGLAAFWIFASASGLATTDPFAVTAYAATLTFVSAGLISLGLARLTELRVEGVDRAARWRWLILVVAVSGAVFVIGVPLAAVLGVPVSAALIGVAGPLAPVLFVIVALIAIPLGLIAELLHLLLPAAPGAPFPDLGPAASPGFGQTQPGQGAASAPDGGWMLWPLLGGLAVLLAIGIGMRLRRPTLDDDLVAEVEIRESEPIGGSLLIGGLPRPRIPWRRPGRTVPRTARDAYPLALTLLVGRPEERRVGETPRDHARRVASTSLGRSVGRLAVDYQLIAFGGRSVSAAEERRALERWRQVERASRRPPPGSGDRDRSI